MNNNKETGLKYDINVWVRETPQEFPVSPWCNGLLIINTGAAGTVVLANGIPIAVNSSTTIGGNRGEIFKGRLQIAFTGAGAQVTVVQKFYIDPSQFETQF